jgi:outer membrane biosynthesis protein TonB
MKKLFLILGVAALFVACTPKTQHAVETPTEDIEAIDEVVVDDVAVIEQPATPAKPAAKPATPPKEEPKVTEPVKEEPVKEEPKKEEPKPDEPKTNVVKGRR